MMHLSLVKAQLMLLGLSRFKVAMLLLSSSTSYSMFAMMWLDFHSEAKETTLLGTKRRTGSVITYKGM